ncbi:hypothetical protein [Acinetobacter sp. WCHAc010052]|uniref:hypothetical protein n=1 Tax=Acinetobacter sp. WCHAc010052 TaxID=2004647 RepID=UPI00196B4234|nr:hypothetical protein [Acinetobacter sp. WCHAc010052]
MNIKFVVVGLLIIAGLFWGNERYWEHTFKEQARSGLKSIKMTDAMRAQISASGYRIEGDILNQYPMIVTFMHLKDYEKESLPAEMKEQMSTIGCEMVERLKGEEADFIKAHLSVFKEDRVTVSYIVQNSAKKEIHKVSQVLADCENYKHLEGLYL